MSIINANPLLAAAGGDYQISRSVRLRSSASAYFNRTFSTGSTTQWTWSAWVKRGTLGTNAYLFSPNNINGEGIYFNSSNQFSIAINGAILLASNAVYRDPSAWYHIVVVSDMGNATASLRCRVYINGVEITSWATDARASYSSWGSFNSAINHNIGVSNANTIYWDGYITEFNFVNGQALTPSSFGETDTITGVWKPKKYTGTYGTNGFYLNFSDPSAATAAAIGKDYSGNGNNWTPNNISVTTGSTYDSMLDVPTPYADGGNGRGNYCVLNPLDFTTVGTISEANLRFTQSSSAARSGRASIGVSSGKWYWEVTNLGGNNSIGVQNATASLGTYCGGDANGWSYFIDGNKYNNGSATSYGASYTTNDVIGVALDMDAGTLTFYKNGTSQGTAFSSLSGTLFPAFSASSVSSVTIVANFGQRPFAYTPPTGFKALNTQNLPDSTIKKGNQYFNAVTWTGDGVDGRTITGVGFNPDLVWAKGRSNTGAHVLADAVRGTNANLYTNLTDAETNPTTGASGGGIGSVTTDGFVLEQGSTNMDLVNTSSRTYVAWQWKESATAGFDIVTYTGTGANRTVAHSLGVTPSMIIVKNRSALENWIVYHRSFTSADSFLRLNTADVVASGASVWNSTYPTSSVFSVGTNTATNANTQNLVAYLFAEVAGFSRFGSYTGNGSSTDGPFVWCGFRPRFILTKNITTGGYWWEMVDSAREPINPSDQTLYANVSDSEYTSSAYNKDLLSNGFKIRGNNAGHNASGDVYIFAAFAENPFKNSLAR